MKTKRKPQVKHQPTPTEIRQACQRIQATWSAGERRKRSHQEGVVHWTPPEVNLRAMEHLTLDQTWAEHGSGTI